MNLEANLLHLECKIKYHLTGEEEFREAIGGSL